MLRFPVGSILIPVPGMVEPVVMLRSPARQTPISVRAGRPGSRWQTPRPRPRRAGLPSSLRFSRRSRLLKSCGSRRHFPPPVVWASSLRVYIPGIAGRPGSLRLRTR
ncbi:uncharacterized protein [Panulirus ornatus]|uniref:uncharacterized protein n=1 Tax=Panulirus ornatus TaxID=150431 RepID=UPI003A888B7E